MTDTCTICGLPLTRATMHENLRDLLNRIETGQGGWLLTLNTEMLARCAKDPSYFELISKPDIITADGMPLVWASRGRGADRAITERTAGVDLVDAYLRLPRIPKYAIIGGVDPVATLALYSRQAQDACKYLFDGVVDLSEPQMRMFVEAITEHDIKAVFIALGVPKQDKLALRLRQYLPHLVVTGIGGTFEILGPQGSRAPQWMQQVGLEWFYRFTKEPGRLWKRYLINYPIGVGFLLKDYFKARA